MNNTNNAAVQPWCSMVLTVRMENNRFNLHNRQTICAVVNRNRNQELLPSEIVIALFYEQHNRVAEHFFDGKRLTQTCVWITNQTKPNQKKTQTYFVAIVFIFQIGQQRIYIHIWLLAPIFVQLSIWHSFLSKLRLSLYYSSHFLYLRR